MFSCLYLFLSGQSDEIEVKFQGKKYSVVQYLSLRLDLPIEFFYILHLSFLDNLEEFVGGMIKFMRKSEMIRLRQ